MEPTLMIRLDHPHARDPERSGAKASTLARLAAQGFRVPPGFVVPTQVLAQYIDHLGLQVEVSALCRGAWNETSLRDAVINLRERMFSAPLPNDLRQALEQTIANQEKETGPISYWAVRSSAIAEDTLQASFAGQYESHLGVTRADVPKAVLKCWASLFNERAIRYRRERNISDCRAAVLVQQMIDADVAGVCFTVDPISGNRQSIVIDASYGLGESVVSGLVTPDSFVVDRASLTLQSRQIGEKEQLIQMGVGGTTSSPVPETLRRSFCLTDPQVVAVAKLALELERARGRAVDIEWAFSRGKLYLLQARPISTAGNT
jgi:phosphoenolpyruvate synthase/pyruvate phosphate dikinase